MYLNTKTNKEIRRQHAIQALMEEDERLTLKQAIAHLGEVERGGKTTEIGLVDDDKAYLWIPLTAEEYAGLKNVFFEAEGQTVNFFELMADNAGDAEVWDWALKAKPGDKFPSLFELIRLG